MCVCVAARTEHMNETIRARKKEQKNRGQDDLQGFQHGHRLGHLGAVLGAAVIRHGMENLTHHLQVHDQREAELFMLTTAHKKETQDTSARRDRRRWKR